MDARPAEPRQRWRLVVAREEAARDLLHRDVVTAWETGLLASGLPVSTSAAATPRPRISFAAPAPVGMLAERELIDVVLSELLLVHDVRGAVATAAPVGYRLVELYDVWLSSPSLASLVAAADYRATVAVGAGIAPASNAIELAIGALLGAARIDLVRAKGHGEVTQDVRPHLRMLRLASDPTGRGGSFELSMRLRLSGAGGAGRPEEIVAALGERLGGRLVAGPIVRERVILVDDRAIMATRADWPQPGPRSTPSG